MRISSFAMTHRNRERERGACPELALHPDPAAVEFHELPAQGEPQPRALYLHRRRPHLAELLEHFLLILWGNADPGVCDRDLHESILWYGAYFNPTTLRGELDGVRQQV